MSRALDTSVALTGQTVTIYALATAVGAIPLARLTASWPRKRVLQVALLIVAITNTLTALSDTALGHLGGWELAFYVSTALTLANMVWVQATLPGIPGTPSGERPRFGATLRIPGLRLILFALATYMVAHNIVYTYVTDYLDSIGMAAQTGWVLFSFGAASILSVVVVGAYIDRHLRVLTVASTVVLAAGILVLAVLAGSPVLVYVAAAAWGFAFGSSPSLFVGAAIRATGPSSDVAQAITITVFSGSIATGALVGGLLIAALGTGSITWAALVLLVAAAVAVVAGKKHAFPART
jgi:predicted MFS family arabinose efflux permease